MRLDMRVFPIVDAMPVMFYDSQELFVSLTSARAAP